jgi:hypothetical protein
MPTTHEPSFRDPAIILNQLLHLAFQLSEHHSTYNMWLCAVDRPSKMKFFSKKQPIFTTPLNSSTIATKIETCLNANLHLWSH